MHRFAAANDSALLVALDTVLTAAAIEVEGAIDAPPGIIGDIPPGIEGVCKGAEACKSLACSELDRLTAQRKQD